MAFRVRTAVLVVGLVAQGVAGVAWGADPKNGSDGNGKSRVGRVFSFVVAPVVAAWKGHLARAEKRAARRSLARDNYAVASKAWEVGTRSFAQKVTDKDGTAATLAALEFYGKEVPSEAHLASDRVTRKELVRLGLAVGAASALLGAAHAQGAGSRGIPPIESLLGRDVDGRREVSRLVKTAASRLSNLGWESFGWESLEPVVGLVSDMGELMFMAPEFGGVGLLRDELPPFDRETRRLTLGEK